MFKHDFHILRHGSVA